MIHPMRPFSPVLHLFFFSFVIFNFSGDFCHSIENSEQIDLETSQKKDGTTRLLLIRHGRTDWNNANRVQGHSDIPLNQQGKTQAKKVAQLLHHDNEPIHAVYSSDLMRAYWTAHEIAKLNNHAITTTPELRERYMGDAEGMDEHVFAGLYEQAFIEMEATIPDRWERWHHEPVPGAETKAGLITRTEKFLRDIAQTHPGKTVALVTHGAVIKTLIMHLADLNHHTPNCCVAEIHYSILDDRFSFVGMRKISP